MIDQTREKAHLNLLSLIVLLVYATVLSFSFTSEVFPLDDEQELFHVRQLETKWNVFGPDLFGLFRPVKNLLFLAFSSLCRFDFKWCRFIGLLVGILSFFPVRAFCRRVLGTEWKAFVAASIWILSPTLVSSVAWLSGLNIQIMAASASASIVMHDSAWDADAFRPSRIVFAGVFLFVALISYEIAISVFPVLVLFDFFLRSKRLKDTNALKAYVFYALIVVAYLALRRVFNSSMNLDGNFDATLRWQIIVSSPFFVAEHFISWFFPFGRMAVVGSYKWGMIPVCILILCAFVLSTIGISALVFRKKSPVVCFCILASFLSIAPVSNCLGFGNGPYGDYYLTFVSTTLSMGCVEACYLLLHGKSIIRPMAITVIVLFGTSRIIAISTAARWSYLWGRGVEAFEESVKSFPNSFANKIMLAQLLFDRNRSEQSMRLCSELESEVSPDSKWMAGVHLLRAMHALTVSHDADLALSMLDKSVHSSVAKSNELKNRHYYRGCVYEDLKNDAVAAENEYELALAGQWTIDSVPCADRLARLKAIYGKRDEAIALWEKAAILDPSNAAVLWNLSVAYRENGDMARSGQFRNAALRLMEQQ